MKLIVFSEAGFEYGFGHFYRMSCICEEALREHGEAKLCLVADEAAKENLNREYVEFVNWHDSENYEFLLDKESTLVVDSYHVDLLALEEFQSLVKDMVVIDDNIRLDYHDMKVLNPNYFALYLDYPKDRNNTYFIGADCTLLRNEFDFHGMRVVKEVVTDVLVTMGGTDPRGITIEMIRAIKKNNASVRLHVVCTRAYLQLDKIRESLDLTDKLYLNIEAKEMSELMQKCDFAIASAGQTTNELIRTQCPAVLVAIADNQVLNTKYLSQDGFVEAIFYSDCLKDCDFWTIGKMFDFEKRSLMARKLISFASSRSGKDLICEIAYKG